MKKALQLLAFSTKEINDRRKDALKSSVNAEYLPVLKHAKPPSDDWLLGGELTESIKKCDDSKKVSEKIMKNRKGQQNTNNQDQGQSYQSYNQQDKFKFKNKGKKDYKSYYKNQQFQNNQNIGNNGHQPQFQQPYSQFQLNTGQQQQQAHLWHQYQQQLQQAQALQAQAYNRQNVGFQQQQWRDQQQQHNNQNAYIQKKKN